MLTDMRRTITILAAVLLLIAIATPVHATVGLEYLGPYPLKLTTVPNQAGSYSGSATVGNSGSENAIVTLEMSSKNPDFSHFTVKFSDNNFTLTPSQRKQFTVNVTSNPSTTPQHNYNASIAILAKAKSGPGIASFNLPVCFPDCQVIPEFPGSTLILASVILAALAFLKARPRKSLLNSKSRT